MSKEEEEEGGISLFFVAKVFLKGRATRPWVFPLPWTTSFFFFKSRRKGTSRRH
jgi:hypothetical protein